MKNSDTIVRAWGGVVLPTLPTIDGVINLKNIGEKLYYVHIPRIPQTGTTVTKSYSIPFSHALIGVYVKHVTGALVDATTSLDFELKFILRENLQFTIAKFSSVEADNHLIGDKDTGSKFPTSYIFNTVAAAGNFVYVSLLVKAIGVI